MDKKKSNEMKGKVETYIDKDGNLVVWHPGPDVDWQRLRAMAEEDALTELFEYQTANGYDWLTPKDLGGFIFHPILGWQVRRDAKGRFISADNIFRFCGYQVIETLSRLQPGRGVIFYKVK